MAVPCGSERHRLRERERDENIVSHSKPGSRLCGRTCAIRLRAASAEPCGGPGPIEKPSNEPERETWGIELYCEALGIITAPEDRHSVTPSGIPALKWNDKYDRRAYYYLNQTQLMKCEKPWMSCWPQSEEASNRHPYSRAEAISIINRQRKKYENMKGVSKMKPRAEAASAINRAMRAYQRNPSSRHRLNVLMNGLSHLASKSWRPIMASLTHLRAGCGGRAMGISNARSSDVAEEKTGNVSGGRACLELSKCGRTERRITKYLSLWPKIIFREACIAESEENPWRGSDAMRGTGRRHQNDLIFGITEGYSSSEESDRHMNAIARIAAKARGSGVLWSERRKPLGENNYRKLPAAA